MVPASGCSACTILHILRDFELYLIVTTRCQIKNKAISYARFGGVAYI